jgi:hypothetical protein
MSDPKQILLALQTADARFVIVGGFAMIAHGSSYITEDLDLVYARDERRACFGILSLSGIIRSKRAAGRPKDKQGLPELERLLEIKQVGEGNP